MPKTTVLSIRLDQKTRETLEKHAKELEMKVSLLAALILKDTTDDWVQNYARKIAERYGVLRIQEEDDSDE